jgi:hypothetical protein
MPLCILNRKVTPMKRDDLFPSKYLKCADLKGQPRVVQIKNAPIETLKSPKAKNSARLFSISTASKKLCR